MITSFTQLACMPVQVGALYALYTLVKTQPGIAKVRPYLPIGTLGALLSLIRRAREERLPDVPAVAQRLMQRRAFAVGALCRPPAATKIPLVSGPRCDTAEIFPRLYTRVHALQYSWSSGWYSHASIGSFQPWAMTRGAHPTSLASLGQNRQTSLAILSLPKQALLLRILAGMRRRTPAHLQGAALDLTRT